MSETDTFSLSGEPSEDLPVGEVGHEMPLPAGGYDLDFSMRGPVTYSYVPPTLEKVRAMFPDHVITEKYDGTFDVLYEPFHMLDNVATVEAIMAAAHRQQLLGERSQ